MQHEYDAFNYMYNIKELNMLGAMRALSDETIKSMQATSHAIVTVNHNTFLEQIGCLNTRREIFVPSYSEN